ncbi:pentapeptide repeat family protein [Geminocystis sp. NIES-3708]|uniref:pentapeptide repeat-containing protein n=1 Tax=Geminocystis sp. NIES-3708 TaxID=1615909 RepID=UPI0005FC9A89|nr:pentapeptide repeat-containing protein [Geminocystis sp. NIES-3708]BAQ60632.1 pentapeptide repeat family protein [Geminocystis sp. NIES-3708]
MANEEHLRILNKGVEVWNKWRQENPDIKPDLVGADLIGVNLIEWKIKPNTSIMDLQNATLKEQQIREIYFKPPVAGIRWVNLSGANLSKANLREANCFGVNLFGANLEGANLSFADFRCADLREVNFLGAKLISTSLCNAKLFASTLEQADLTSADLTKADLRSTNLCAVQAIFTNFQKAKLTGACIEDWNINSYTNLDEVICDYIYLRLPEQERRPSDPNKIFDQGDFQRLIKKVMNTIDLIFSNGIDWSAFLTSFNNLRVEDGRQDLSVRGIEHKDDGIFVVRINTAQLNQIDKGEVEKSFWQYYQPILDSKENQIKLLSSHNKSLQKEIESKRKNNTKLLNIIKTMAEKDNQTYNDFRGAKISGGVAGRDYTGNVINNYTDSSLNQTVTRIETLINDLCKDSSIDSTVQQMIVATKVINKIEDDPNWKQKTIQAFQQGLLEAIKTNPIGAFVAGAIEGWS